MSKELSTDKEQKAPEPDKDLPGPLEHLYDAQCDNPECGRGIDMNTSSGYCIDGPCGSILRVYCSAKCLATVMDPTFVKILAQEVAEILAKDAK